MAFTWNKKTKTIAWIVGITLLIALLLILTRKKSKAQSKPSLLPGDNPVNDPALDSATSHDNVSEQESNTFPLKFGKRGKEVEQAQMYLLKKYGAQFPKYGIDGIWEKETEDNMVTHMKKNSISKDFYYKVGMDKFKTTKFK